MDYIFITLIGFTTGLYLNELFELAMIIKAWIKSKEK